jgi:hypothetical protein
MQLQATKQTIDQYKARELSTLPSLCLSLVNVSRQCLCLSSLAIVVRNTSSNRIGGGNGRNDILYHSLCQLERHAFDVVLVSVGACLLKDPLHVLCIVGVDLDGGAFVVLAKRVLVTPLHLLGVRDAVLRLAWGRGDGALLIDDLRWEHVECTVEAHGDVWQEDSASALETYPPNAPVSQSLSLSLSQSTIQSHCMHWFVPSVPPSINGMMVEKSISPSVSNLTSDNNIEFKNRRASTESKPHTTAYTR